MPETLALIHLLKICYVTPPVLYGFSLFYHESAVVTRQSNLSRLGYTKKIHISNSCNVNWAYHILGFSLVDTPITACAVLCITFTSFRQSEVVSALHRQAPLAISPDDKSDFTRPNMILLLALNILQNSLPNEMNNISNYHIPLSHFRCTAM